MITVRRLLLAAGLFMTTLNPVLAVADIPAYVERLVYPPATDKAIDASGPQYLVLPPRAAARGKLFVFLPGTGASPAHYREILRLAADRGYHSIGLSYANTATVFSLCLGSSDPDCHGRVRQEIVFGSDDSPLVAVNKANALENRARALLRYLASRYPLEGWGQFVAADGRLATTRMTLAGHSQGGGHAAYIGKLVPLERVVLFSSPMDWDVGANAPARWIASASQTPPNRYFGFTHEQDYWQQVSVIWQQLGMGTQVQLLRSGMHSLGSSRQFITNYNAAGSNAHGLTIVDAQTPRSANGAPLFLPLWQQLCFP